MYDQQEGVESSSRIVDEYGDGNSLDRLQGRNYYLQTNSNKEVSDKFVADMWAVFDSAGNLLLKKHHDYGPLNVAHSPGGALNGLRVRMWDKIARINNLLDSGVAPSNESLRDSFMDLMNYSAIAQMVLDKTWPELPND
jgi:hypothetical protein